MDRVWQYPERGGGVNTLTGTLCNTVDIMAVREDGGGAKTHSEQAMKGRGGVHTPTGSQSNIVFEDPRVKPVKRNGTDGWKAESKFVFNKRGKLTENDILEMKRTHGSLKDWIKPQKGTQSGMGSVKVRVSLFEELNLHGGAHTPLLGPATITEKGVGLGQVIGLQSTGDQTAHTPVPGAQADLPSVVINCLLCTNTVQC